MQWFGRQEKGSTELKKETKPSRSTSLCPFCQKGLVEDEEQILSMLAGQRLLQCSTARFTAALMPQAEDKTAKAKTTLEGRSKLDPFAIAGMGVMNCLANWNAIADQSQDSSNAQDGTHLTRCSRAALPLRGS